ncbi:helix-turn-helix domain-containing protein [Bacillus mangrovi]|uniref:Helix-turn-helix domain-containing protein n=1 Tax=Metabacillus mangrovi TaxID=1491830 RepID=A0A7X2S4I7_9BACI|nr:helix-turn-helix domain-containing protein [Metabacillus mangrovi]MTH53544.1 helix-turn-helix domain-containing protein [Metabacillus mangrovi]
MNETAKAKLLLHPVRMKIVQSLVNGKQLSSQQISGRMKDVPPATLYRHINRLLESGILEVVKENQIRGTIEKIYSLKEAEPPSKEEVSAITKEEHMDLFLSFTNQLAGRFEDYLNQPEYDVLQDGVGFSMGSFQLSDEEFMELMDKMGSLLKEAMDNEPSPERRERHLATIILPEPKDRS